MATWIAILISGITGSFAIFFGLKGYRRNDIKDIEERAARDAKINYKLDQIIDDNKEYKSELIETKKRVDEIDRRVVIVEQSTKSAHKRLDGIVNAKEDRENGDK